MALLQPGEQVGAPPRQHRRHYHRCQGQDCHVGAHKGRKPEDLIASSLRKVIELPTITKAGVNILTADFKRLREHFGLNPQGAVELSHLHNMVTLARPGAQLGFCTAKLSSLAGQVKTQLGLPLDKGSSTVRTSNWSRKYLTGEQPTPRQMHTQAFIIHHCLKLARIAMEAIPPAPLWAESRLLKKLKDSRENIAKSRRCEPFRAAQNSVLEAIMRDMLQTKADFLKIKGSARRERRA
ncbi:hypothetical protein SLS53_006754 [Cytospora paraplurivora]|uniref:HRDC domain-containing protein n=1 Tax=Cytospora paraplurivora TaxID=2898453 RepID=A0AAN9U268_9PEZI